jgi:hypothetical protein
MTPRPGLELSRNEAAMLPGPAKPSSPAPPRLNVHCDLPLAPGNVRFSSKPGIIGAHSDRVWPLRELCESSGSARSELAFEITRLLPLSAVVLEPAHPFYAVELETSSRSELDLRVRRKQRAAVQLWLEGAGCERVESLELIGDALPLRQIRLGARKVTRLGHACTHRIELPFEAFGKTLQLRLEPADLATPSLVFDAAVLRAPLQQRPRPRSASVDGPCIPPRYCRD